MYPVAAGAPQYSGNFIPEIWSGKLIQNFYDATVLNEIANTEYEGDIKNAGDKVHIRTTPEVIVHDYVKGQNLRTERPNSPKLELLIDKGQYFSCVEDDVDKVQTDQKLMDEWSKDASSRMKIRIDQRVLHGMQGRCSPLNRGKNAGRISGDINLGSAKVTAATGDEAKGDHAIILTEKNIIDTIVDAGVVLDEANMPEDGRYMLIPARLAGLIKQSELKDASLTGDGSSTLRNGRMGMIDRFTLYMSHNLPRATTGLDKGAYAMYAGHKRGLTFASQYTEMETLRAESTFGTIIRGLQVYGWEVVIPESIVEIHAHVQRSKAEAA